MHQQLNKAGSGDGSHDYFDSESGRSAPTTMLTVKSLCGARNYEI